MSIEQIRQALDSFGVPLSEEQLGAIQKYLAILCIWNQRISLTSVDDPLEIVSRHFGESIFVGALVQLSHGRLADVGTGAGFPGLALKIAFPELSLILIEPNLKKCAFLNEVKDALDLRGVEIKRARYEEFAVESRLDFICSRALGDHRRFLTWAHECVSATGKIAMWLGLEDSILVGRTRGWTWDLPVRIPGSRRRVILCGRPDLQ